MAQAQKAAECAVTTQLSSWKSKALVTISAEGGTVSRGWRESDEEQHPGVSPHQRVLS